MSDDMVAIVAVSAKVVGHMTWCRNSTRSRLPTNIIPRRETWGHDSPCGIAAEFATKKKPHQWFLFDTIAWTMMSGWQEDALRESHTDDVIDLSGYQEDALRGSMRAMGSDGSWRQLLM